MPHSFTVRLIVPGNDLSDAYEVRKTVFIDEQGFDLSSEIDDTDPVAHHVVLYDGARPVATGRVYRGGKPGTWIIGRVAVLPERRGGTGSILMHELEHLAVSLGARFIELGAQCRAQPFYEKLGYSAFGELYYDEFCPHTHMRKTL